MRLSKYITSSEDDRDVLFEDAAKLVIQSKNASASYLQRQLSMGYARCARILDELEEAGIVGSADGAKPREVLYKKYEDFSAASQKDPQINRNYEPDFSNYKVPKIHLSTNKAQWGKDFSEIELPDFEIPLGNDESGNLITEHLDKLDHLIVVGNPQSEKMVFLDTVLLSLLTKLTPNQVRFILIDESNYLNLYSGIPHQLTPPINDPEKALSALKWTMIEMDRRQKLFDEEGIRKYDDLNDLKKNPLNRIVIVVRLYGMEEEIDWMLRYITSFGQTRGVHLIFVADQLSTTFISSHVKANIPDKLIFKVSSSSDSTLSGVKGAEKLIRGEAVFTRVTKTLSTIFTSDKTVKEVVIAVKKAGES